MNDAHLFFSSGRSRARAKLGVIRSAQFGLSVARLGRMFCQLLPAPLIAGEAYRLPPSVQTNDGWTRTCFGGKTGPMWPQQAVLGVVEKARRKQILVQFWTSHVRSEYSTLPIEPDEGGFLFCHDGHGQRRWLEIARMKKAVRVEQDSRRV